MPSIIVSYRKDDARAIAGRLHDALINALGDSALAMGVDTLVKPGDDYVDAIESGVKAAEVVVVLIGPGWYGNWQTKSDDYDYIAITTALNEKKRVIPVLLEGAAQPTEDALPDPLKPLARRMGMPLTDDSFRDDSGKLIAALPKAAPPAPKPATAPSAPQAAAASLTPEQRQSMAAPPAPSGFRPPQGSPAPAPSVFRQPQPSPYGPAQPYGQPQMYGMMQQGTLPWFAAIIIVGVAWAIIGFGAEAAIKFLVDGLIGDIDKTYVPLGIIGGLGGLALGFAVRAVVPEVSITSVVVGAIGLAIGFAVLIGPNWNWLADDFIYQTMGIESFENILRAYIGIRGIAAAALLAVAYSVLNPTIPPHEIRVNFGMTLVMFGALAVALFAGWMAMDLIFTDASDPDPKLMVAIWFGVAGALMSAVVLFMTMNAQAELRMKYSMPAPQQPGVPPYGQPPRY